MKRHSPYLSKQSHFLVYVGVEPGRPVLTVENYPKWYGFQVVMPDGTVREESFGLLDDLATSRGVSPHVDHVPNAELVPALAEKIGWILDFCSYEMMVGRWVSEIVDPRKYNF